jgi:hypothetical protein
MDLQMFLETSVGGYCLILCSKINGACVLLMLYGTQIFKMKVKRLDRIVNLDGLPQKAVKLNELKTNGADRLIETQEVDLKFNYHT